MSKITVMIVDDHALVRDGIRALLELVGDFEVVGEAADGKEACEKIKELSPDVVLMDLAMPVMTGLEATRKICKEFPEISFNIYLWAGNVFSTSSISGENYSKAFNYFKNALDINEKSSEPYLAISGFYNKELNLPPFEEIIKVLETGLDRVENKSKVCFALSDLYKNVGKKEGAQKYRSLGEQFQRKGH